MFMPSLFHQSGPVRFTRVGFFFSVRPRPDTAFAAVECHVRFVSDYNRPVHVHVLDVNGVHMHHRSVIEKGTVAPFSADKADATITEAVVNATVKTKLRSTVHSLASVAPSSPPP